ARRTNVTGILEQRRQAPDDLDDEEREPDERQHEHQHFEPLVELLEERFARVGQLPARVTRVGRGIVHCRARCCSSVSTSRWSRRNSVAWLSADGSTRTVSTLGRCSPNTASSVSSSP